MSTNLAHGQKSRDDFDYFALKSVPRVTLHVIVYCRKVLNVL
jgi:hypothetical protein